MPGWKMDRRSGERVAREEVGRGEGSRVWWWLASGFALVLLVASQWRLRAMAFDDAYIHLRIVRNLLGTGQAFFNPGERVMATSSPVWTVLLGLLHAGAVPWILPVLEGVLVWGAAVLAARVAWLTAAENAGILGRAQRGVLAVSAGIVLMLLLLGSSMGQMETPLAALLVLAAWLAALRQGGAALPLLACAACVRLELLPLLALAAVGWVWWSRRWWPVLGAGLVVAAVAGWVARQFGVLLPHSMHAKQVAYGFSVGQALHQFVTMRVRDELFGLLLLVLVGAAVMNALRAWREGALRVRAVLALGALLWGLLVVGEYVSQRAVVFDWYRPLFLLPLALGVMLVEVRRFPRRWLGTGFGICRAMVLMMLVWPTVRPAMAIMRAAVSPDVRTESAVDDGDAARVRTYLEVGAALRESCPGARLMTPEIGALGWAFPGEVEDGFGIATPAALRFQPLMSGAPRGGLPADFVLESRPDVVVSYQVLDVELRGSAAVRAAYRLVELPPSAREMRGGALDAGWRTSRFLDVWVRRGGSCDEGLLELALREKF